MAGENQNPGGDSQNSGGDKGQDQQIQDWRSALPDTLVIEDGKGGKVPVKSLPSVAKFRGKDWSEAGPQILTSYLNMEKLHGSSVRIPGPDASAEERQEFFRKLGVPETPDKYGDVAEVPEGLPWDKEAEKRFLSKAHELGLTSAQAKGVLGEYIKYVQETVDTDTGSRSDEIRKSSDALKQKWGAGYDRNTGLVQRLIAETASPELQELIEQTKFADGTTIGNHPAFLEWALRLGEPMLEAGYIASDALLTKNSDAKQQIAEIMGDQNHPYWQGDKAAIEKVKRLFEIAYPGQAA